MPPHRPGPGRIGGKARDMMQVQLRHQVAQGADVDLVRPEARLQGAGGAVNPFSTIDREDVGTTLTITPRINEGTGMRLTIAQEVSSISSSAIASDVITNTRRIETEVFVNDGNILVLGGLMDDQLRENEQRVPGLGRIPGLRWLFRARNTERVESALMVFIRPTILRNSADANSMTSDRYRRLQGIQSERAEEPVPLMNDVDRPALPAFEEGQLPPMSPPETKQICYSVLTDAQKHQFEETNELDLSFSVQKLSRFRANIFLQRGAVAGAWDAVRSGTTIIFRAAMKDALDDPSVAKLKGEFSKDHAAKILEHRFRHGSYPVRRWCLA